LVVVLSFLTQKKKSKGVPLSERQERGLNGLQTDVMKDLKGNLSSGGTDNHIEERVRRSRGCWTGPKEAEARRKRIIEVGSKNRKTERL